LDAFPHHALGNLVQGPLVTVQDGRCLVLAVTRNGALVRLGYDPEERGWYSQALSVSGTPVVIGHLAVSPAESGARWTSVLAVGGDGKLYALSLAATTVSFTAVAVENVGAGVGWSRVAFAGKRGRRLFLERLDGRIFAFEWSGSVARFERLATREEAAFAPSLLRPDGVLLNPFGPEPEGKQYARLVPSELEDWEGPLAAAPAKRPQWTPPPEPSYSRPKPRDPDFPSRPLPSAAYCDAKQSTRECRTRALREACTYQSATGAERQGTCRLVAGTPNHCSCY
jgi:hypothetical protein